MLRLLLGLALLPLSASLLWASARTLAGVAAGTAAAAPFAAGLGIAVAAWLVGRSLAPEKGPLAWASRAARWSSVLGHELTHALAAWALGGKVYGMKVGERDGHVDLSESGAFVALAPYCVPLAAFAVAVGYRALLWARPGAGAEALFLFLMGGALGAHLLFTWGSLTETRQPDLDAAGGVVFSIAVIMGANALVILLLLKGLFPGSVPLWTRLRESGGFAGRAWTRAGEAAKPAARRARGAASDAWEKLQ